MLLDAHHAVRQHAPAAIVEQHDVPDSKVAPTIGRHLKHIAVPNEGLHAHTSSAKKQSFTLPQDLFCQRTEISPRDTQALKH